MNSSLNISGERVIADGYKKTDQGLAILAMHLATYEYALQYCKDKNIIDLGCGTGYGTYHISKDAKSAIGIDISQEAIEYACDKFKKNNLQFSTVDANKSLPFADNFFDVAISFQVIEHIKNDNQYLEEAHRILKPGGILLLATPDRKMRLLPLQKPWNKWHIREYSARSLGNLAGKLFKVEASLSMVAPSDITNLEFKRYRKTKWLTLLATLPLMPDALRIKLLTLASKINNIKTAPETSIKSTYNDIAFASHSQTPLNLLLVCKK